MTLRETIEKHKLPMAYIARRIKMSKQTFNNKLKGNNFQTFSGSEYNSIMAVLAEMTKDVSGINEVAKTMARHG